MAGHQDSAAYGEEGVRAGGYCVRGGGYDASVQWYELTCLKFSELQLCGKTKIIIFVIIETYCIVMTIFDDYKKFKGECRISPHLLWDYDLEHFDWWKSRKIVVSRILERGWLKDYFAAFNLYGGIDGFKEIVKELPYISDREINFVCATFGLKREELQCYTRKRSREQLFNS